MGGTSVGRTDCPESIYYPKRRAAKEVWGESAGQEWPTMGISPQDLPMTSKYRPEVP